ncbi:hypothetical protein ScalyP_jg2573 [Parmales sp. scaly parma]|nr:hypothetical protein ScalyP_jg2573 [Parmales sp. scaly parma]
MLNFALLSLIASCHSLSNVLTLRSVLTPLTKRKLTFVPEINLNNQLSDSTNLLVEKLQIESLSRTLRVKSKAGVVVLCGSVDQLSIFCSEQRAAVDDYPGPLNVIFKGVEEYDCEAVRVAGADGILSSFDTNDEGWEIMMRSALDENSASGLSTVVEVVTSAGFELGDLEEVVGDNVGAIVITGRDSFIDFGEEGEDADNGESEPPIVPIAVPKISGDINSVPVLGSVRVLAGGGRMGEVCAEMNEGGYSGAFLRQECVPKYQFNTDLAEIAKFFVLAITNLKSMKSKNFGGLRSKMKIEKDVPMEWFNYQKDIMESGALGTTEKATGINTAEGDFVGF